jgi:hypothetical protein
MAVPPKRKRRFLFGWSLNRSAPPRGRARDERRDS